MGKLTTKERKAIPTKDFAGPNRSFPIEDKGHAKAALGRAHFAADPAAIKRKVYAKYPEMAQHLKHLGKR